jgi:hypothetical protein
MAQGWVTTARGEALNLDALKDAANLPLVQKKQTKTEVPKRDYRSRKPINVRGFQPGAGEHKVQEMPEGVADTVARLNPDEMPVKTSFTETGEAKTLADVTGVKIKTTPEKISRAKARASSDIAPEVVATEALDGILGDLANANPNAEAAADAEEEKPKKTRSRSTKKAAE